MQHDGDLLTDRKRLKRSLVTWRVLAILALVAAAAIFISRSDQSASVGGVGRDYIALVTVDGIMDDDRKREELLEFIRKDRRAKALLVRFNSPGGTAVGGEELFVQLKRIGQEKPVVGIMRTVCASACYMAAMGTEHIMARAGTLTGSIGVMVQTAEVSELANKLGIHPITIKSGEFKDAPSFTEPMTQDQRAVVKQVVMNAYAIFVGIVAEGRKLPEARVRELADGRVYTGLQAMELKLIDSIGGEEEAVAWLAKTHKISPDLSIVEKKPEREIDSLLQKLASSASVKIFGKSMVGLDGLVSIWHPSMH